MIKLWINPIYDELETREFNYNDICPDNEIRAEIESHMHDLWDEEREFEDIIQNEPQ